MGCMLVGTGYATIPDDTSKMILVNFTSIICISIRSAIARRISFHNGPFICNVVITASESLLSLISVFFC